MQNEIMKNRSKAGVIYKELAEIKKMQKTADSYWSLWSNTCGGLYTVICC